MKILNIKRFATASPDTFEMNTNYAENYDTFGNCISVTISTISSLDITRITKNGIDVSSEWSGIPGSNATKTYTSNTTETLTFYGSNGQEYVETIDITSVETNPVIPQEFYASNANIKINSDVKVGKMSLKEIDDTVSTLFDLIYPVGSIYYTNNANFSPNISFNGTWEQIKDTFLLAAGDTYVGGTSGGNTTHTHGAGSLYANIGSPSGNANALGFSAIGWHGTNSTYSVGNTASSTAGGHPGRSHDTSVGGTTGSGSSLPPYIVVYVWKRVS